MPRRTRDLTKFLIKGWISIFRTHRKRSSTRNIRNKNRVGEWDKKF